MKTSILFALFIIAFSFYGRSQQRQDPNAAYWNAYNESMNKVHKGATITNKAATVAVRVLSRSTGAPGRVIGAAYNSANRIIQKKVGKPR